MIAGRAVDPTTWRDETLTQAGIIGGALLLAHLVRALGALDPDHLDFSIFYIAARGWLHGEPLYSPQWPSPLVNYNPPHFHLLVLPLAALPLPAAFLAWTAGSGVLAALTARLAIHESGAEWTRHDRLVLIAGILTSAGVGAALRLGQLSWYLAVMMTLAWRSARRGSWLACGAWLGLSIGLKPFLLLFLPVLVIRGRWVAAGVSLLAAAGSIVAGGIVFGWPALEAWLTLLRTSAPPHQTVYFINASWTAVVSRSGLPLVLAALGSFAIAAVTILTARTADEDRAWLLTTVAALLASPLGWIYYTPLLLGPLVALAHEGRLPAWAWRLWPLLAFPSFSRDAFQWAPLFAVSLGSIYAWGFLGLWTAGLRPSAKTRL